MKKYSPYVKQRSPNVSLPRVLFGMLLCTILFTAVSCAPRLQKGQARMPDRSHAVLPAVIPTDSVSQKFNLQLDFMKNHFSGMLIARRMANDEVRLLFTTYFGLSVFDFTLRGDTLHVNSCVEPMRKKNILRILEHDLKQVFLPGQTVRVKQKSAIFEKRISGSGMGKAVITLSGYSGNQPGRIHIKHPWIRLKIQFDKLNDNNP